MSYASVVKAQRAQRNRAYVRELLRQRQPAFAAALESAVQYLSCALAQTGNDVGLMMTHETCHLADSLAVGLYRAGSRHARTCPSTQLLVLAEIAE